MEHPTINDLPNEVLELIFDQLGVDDLKHASLVCKRWSDLAFSGRRMERVKLVPNFPLAKDLLQSNRKYRHLVLKNATEVFAYVKNLFQMFGVTELRIRDYHLSRSSLRSILLEVPNLQHLSINEEPQQVDEMIEPFPVMRKLERLEIEHHNPRSTLPWHTIAPSLQGLKMCCNSEEQLEQWRLFRGQLKQVYATFYEENLLNRFCEMTFPLLEELTMKSELPIILFKEFDNRHDLFRRHDFFRRNTSLRLLRLDDFRLDKTLIQDITNYNKKLTALEIRNTGYCEPGSMESLSQLTELKHLRTVGPVDTCFFGGCEALTSLQSLYINGIRFYKKNTLGFFKNLFKIAPQLRCLELRSVTLEERDVQFICHNFSKLTRLELSWPKKATRDCLSGIDRLPHLLNLELNLINSHMFFNSIIPQNKVRYLTLDLPNDCNENKLLPLPEIFPQLNRLNLFSWRECLPQSTVDRLRQLLPNCAVKLYDITSEEIKGSKMMPVWDKEWKFHHRGVLNRI